MTKITLNHITKIEGHARLTVAVKNGEVKTCELASIEGARFFEGLCLGKHWADIREITSKICGICSCAHTIACLKAIENAFGIQISEQSEQLRELITIGERIRSHATHLYLLVLPDYLGYESGVAMAGKYKKEVLMALDLVKLGNNIVETIGGKEMHPFTSVIGGFTYVPPQEKLNALRKRLEEAKPACLKTVEMFAKLKYPKFERKTEYLAMMTRNGFPLHYGNIVTSSNIDASPYEYEKFISEYITDYNHSKFAVRDGKGYMVGALARMNLAQEYLDDECKGLIKKHKIELPSINPFHNSICQAIELVHWTNRAIDIIKSREFKFEGLPDVKPRAGHGISCTEAPRGMLLHEYVFDEKGICTKCNIITPTAQLLRNMEDDIRGYLPGVVKRTKSKDRVNLEVEKLIRAYDPCFSCSTHFLEVDWKEE